MADLNARIKPQKSSTAGEVPQASDLEVSELAVNTADGKLFVKHTDNSIKEISGGGAVSSVNGETGVVSLGVQDMNDYSPNFTPPTGTIYTYDRPIADQTTEWTCPDDGIYSTDSVDNTKRWIGRYDDDNTDIVGIFPFDGGTVWWTFDLSQPWNQMTYTNRASSSTCTGGSKLILSGVVNGWPLDDSADKVLYVSATDLGTGVAVPLADGDYLRYDGLDFRPQQLATVAETGAYSDLSGKPTLVTSIDNLTDVDTSTAAPTDGQVLAWVDANNQWEPADAAGGAVDSVNNQTGVVSLGVVDMDDYSPRYVSADPAWLMSTTFDNSSDFTGDGQGYLTGGTFNYVYLRKIDADGVDRTSQLLGIQVDDVLTFSWNGGASTDSKTVFEAPEAYTGYVRIRVVGSTETWSNNERVQIGGGTLSAAPIEVPKATGDLLTWNSVTSKFEPTPKPLATVATTGAYSDLSGTPTLVTSIDDLTDVDTSTAAPTDGQVLTWDNANSVWEPATPVVTSAATARTLLGIGEYADDASAGTGGVASGALYYNTTSSDYRLKT